MPPQISLLLCILFIICLFIMDSRRKSKVSHALWIPSIWIMIIGSRFVSQWLNLGAGIESPEAYLEGSPLDRFVFIIFIVAGIITLSKRDIRWSQILRSNAWIILLIWYAGVSIMWSDFPFVSFKRWIKEIGNIIMVLIVLTDPDPDEAVKTLIRRCAYVLIPLSVVLIKYYPELGRSYGQWTGETEYMGVTTSKNSLGKLCLICGLFFFWNLFMLWRKRSAFVDKKEVFVYVLFLPMTLWLLIKSNSATSLGSLIIGICILSGLSIIKKGVRYIGVYFFSVVMIFMILQLSFDIIGISISNLGRDVTLTDRTYLWEDVMDMGINPLIGSGYESFWLGSRLAKLWENHWWKPNQAHNGYLETYLNLGLIGLFLLIGVIVSTYRKIRKTLLFDFDYGRFRMAFLFTALVLNITEAAFKGLSLMWIIFLIIAMDVPHISKFKNPIGTNTNGVHYLLDDN